MHLVAESDQTVRIPDIGVVEIAEGESIRTELSHKYDRETVDDLLREAGLTLRRWETGDDDMFALAVAQRTA